MPGGDPLADRQTQPGARDDIRRPVFVLLDGRPSDERGQRVGDEGRLAAMPIGED